MSNIVKRFKSCFVCGIDIYDDKVVLEDSGRNQFVVEKSDKAAFESFAKWFKSFYLKGIPQTLSIIEYQIVSKNEDETFCKVNKIFANADIYNISSRN